MKLLFMILFLAACTKQEPVTRCQAVTLLFKDTRDTIIHWCEVCDEELVKMHAQPVESVVNKNCDPRIQVMIIGKDKCKKW